MTLLAWRKLSLVLGCTAIMAVPAAAQVTTITFQDGANGYDGTVERFIDDRVGTTPATEFDGNTVSAAFVDGFAVNAGSPDTQMLIRFDGSIGSGVGQIPSGATILDAKLTVTTGTGGNAQTSGPFGVAGLLQPFVTAAEAANSGGALTATSYFNNFSNATLGSRGAWYQDGYATRPTGGYGFKIPGDVSSANVTSIVQSWANGQGANGLVVQAGMPDTATAAANNSDGWQIQTSGYPFVGGRPKLEVTYTTAPVAVKSFQEGTDGYSGTTMALVRSGTNALIADTDDLTNPERTEDGALLDQTFLDGAFFTNTNGTTNSPDDLALLKFNNVFGNGAGQASSTVPVAKAWVVVTSGDTSTAVTSPGPWTVHTMLRSWDTTSLHSSFGAQSGLDFFDGDISEPLDSKSGMIRGSEVWFDVTEYLEGVRTGATDNGVAIKTVSTADGWQIHATGSTNTAARPRLVVYSAELTSVTPTLSGDYNDDGVVDAADYTVWRDALGSTNALAGNGNEAGGSAGVVDQADYSLWQANFGKVKTGGPLLVTGGESAVPEPTAVVVASLGALALLAVRRR